jgi:hypothetical protein
VSVLQSIYCIGTVCDKAQEGKSLSEPETARGGWQKLFEIARVLVRLDHVASIIVNADHGIM